jgi:Holliday junction DNA helicase RuvB
VSRNELLSPEPDPDESRAEADDRLGLRPRTLDDFVGQSDLKQRLRVVLGAARQRKQPPDHMLFAGPPGLGKTTLAHIVANELHAELHNTSGPALEGPRDLAAILANLQHGDVLFIDEIHRLPRAVEEVLYPAMEDFHVDLIMGKGPAARTLRMKLEAFTLVGATTRTGLITGPLRDRFGLTERLDFYEPDDLESIIERAAVILEVGIDAEGAREIARRSRGTPRIANRLLRQVRDYSQVHASGRIDVAVARAGLTFFGVDELGLDRATRAVLERLCHGFGGGPVGLSTLAVATSEPTETVEDVYEPFLIQQGLLIRTPRGRVATPLAWKHLGLAAPRADDAPNLFE